MFGSATLSPPLRSGLGAALRRLGTARDVTAVPTKQLKILVVDGYSKKGRADFAKLGIPLASQLYSEAVLRQTPAGVDVSFATAFPCEDAWELPSDDELAGFDGCAFTGSSYSVNDAASDVDKQLELCKRALDCGVSLFGSCWALQLAVKALGGRVELNTRGREVGFGREILLTPEGRAHPMYTGKRTCFQAFQSHSDHAIEVPACGQVLAGNTHSQVQALSVVCGVTESWFVQYHPEYDLQYYSQLIGQRQERMISMGFFKDEAAHQEYVRELAELSEDHSRKDLWWKYGIQMDDITNTTSKEAEIRNWVRYLISRI